jgi:5-methylcytosine-specific restriction endonuclease McrA
MKKINLKAFVIRTLRRASMRWPPKNEALVKSRIERGLYQCAMCKNAFKKKDVNVDHIDPVVSIETGFTTFDDFINRLFVEADKMQVLCSTCHDSKSLVESGVRDHYRKKKKPVKKRKKTVDK